jgi:hypothetical protein
VFAQLKARLVVDEHSTSSFAILHNAQRAIDYGYDSAPHQGQHALSARSTTQSNNMSLNRHPIHISHPSDNIVKLTRRLRGTRCLFATNLFRALLAIREPNTRVIRQRSVTPHPTCDLVTF